MENLSDQELIAISGGGVSDGNQATMGLSLTATTDSLLDITFTRSYGHYKSSTTLSVGNNVSLNLCFLA